MGPLGEPGDVLLGQEAGGGGGVRWGLGSNSVRIHFSFEQTRKETVRRESHYQLYSPTYLYSPW